MTAEKTIYSIEMLSDALKKRDRSAIEFIHEHYYHRIKRYISDTVHSNQDVDDLTENVFLELCKKNGQNKDKDYNNPEAYLIGIAKNQICQYNKKNSELAKIIPIAIINVLNKDTSEKKNPYEQILLSENKQLIEQAVEKLPPKEREAIKLRLIEDLSYEQAAQKAKCSKMIFYTRFYKGLQFLKKILNHNSLKIKDLQK